MDYADFDWELKAAFRKERVRLSLLGVGFVGGLVLAVAGLVFAGGLLMIGTALAFVSRVIVGMLKPPASPWAPSSLPDSRQQYSVSQRTCGSMNRGRQRRRSDG